MQSEVTITQVKDLRPDSMGANLLGLAICKHTPRQVKDTRAQNQKSSQRFVLNFTIRDVTGCINGSVWGGEEFINAISADFKIGDVIVVTNALITLKGSSNEAFNPTNSSPFSLSVNEKQGGRVAFCEEDCSDAKFLLHAPIRPNNDFFTLSEIYEQGESMEGQFVNILAVVMKITDVQHLTTKNGKELEKMEITFFDNTSDSFKVVVWEREYFSYINQWAERQSVIFAVDIRLSMNKFKNCMQGTFTNKTICILDPDTNEAQNLHDYAMEYADQIESDKNDRDGPSAGEEELKVYTIEEIIECRRQAEADGFRGVGQQSFIRGLLYPVITNLNIDDKARKIWCLRCNSCRYRLASSDAYTCSNDQCVTKEDPSKFATERVFDIDLTLSDHTGSLEQCRIGGYAAEKMFGLSVEAFESLTSQDLTDLKWSWLMERCKIGFKYNSDHPAAKPRIELCEKSSLEEALSAIKA